MATTMSMKIRRTLAAVMAALVLSLGTAPTAAYAHHGHTGHHYGVSQGQGFHGKHIGAGLHG